MGSISTTGGTGLDPTKMVFPFNPVGVTSPVGAPGAPIKGQQLTQAQMEALYKQWSQAGPDPSMPEAGQQNIQRWFDYVTKYNTTLNSQKATQDEQSLMNEQQDKNMIGGLNSRGLGRSFVGNNMATGGQGRGSYNNMSMMQKQNATNTDANYNSLLSSISDNFASKSSDDSTFWTDYAGKQQQYNSAYNSTEANIADYLSAITNAGKSAVTFPALGA